MSLFVEEKTSSALPPLPEDTYPAVCYALIDIGDQYSQVFEKYTKKVVIGWELIGETVTIDGEEQPRTFFNTYTASLSTKSLLRKDLVSWRGRDFTVDELKGFNLRNIVGIPCMLQIVHKKNADGSKVYANLASVTKVPKMLKIEKGKLAPVIYDIDESDPAIVETLPQWLQDKIHDSRSYVQRMDELSASPAQPAPTFEEIEDADGELPF